MNRERRFPLGARIELDQLAGDPHPWLHRLRASEPVSWLPALDGWLVTRYSEAVAAMRDARTFTVDDPRFSTAKVIGPSMLSLDGEPHARHRDPFVAGFRPRAVAESFAQESATESERLLDRIAGAGQAELRAAFAGPLAAAIVCRAVGLGAEDVDDVRAWYGRIVDSVTSITAGRGPTDAGTEAFAALSARLRVSLERPETGSLLAQAARDSALEVDELLSAGAVLLFGGIETTEAMIANALLHLLEHRDAQRAVREQPARLGAAIEESLRLEPAAAVIDRYCTADTELGGAAIARGELVRISITAANRDPAVFADPDRFDLLRAGRRHLAFAQGEHVCLGVHLARLEARTGLAVLLARLPGLALDARRPAKVRGLVFRKPADLHALWDPVVGPGSGVAPRAG